MREMIMLAGMKKFAVAALISAVALSGCSSSAATTTKGTQSPTEASSAPESSVAQWAGLVAERKLELDDWYEQWDKAVCSSAASMEIDCNIQLTIASMVAETNQLVISGPSNPSANTYLGEPPSEIAALYDDTLEVAEAAQAAGKAWVDAGCETEDAGECIGLAFEFEYALDSVRTKFAAWSPYL